MDKRLLAKRQAANLGLQALVDLIESLEARLDAAEAAQAKPKPARRRSPKAKKAS